MQREFKISLSQEHYSDVVYLSQYDDDYDVIFHVTNKYSAADVGGKSAKFTGTRSDGLGFTFTSTAVGSSVSFHINTSLTACAGTHTAEIVFYDSNDLYFGSANVQVIVEKAAHPEGTIDADEEALRELAEQVQEIVDTAAAEVKGEAESWAVGERDGEPVSSDDPTYQNNAKFYAEQAAQIAEDISGVTDQVATNTSDISDLKEDLSVVTDNLVDIPYGRYKIDINTGAIQYQPTSRTIFGLSDKIPCDAESTYTITFFLSSHIGGTVHVHFYDASKDWISGTRLEYSSNYSSYVFTPPSTAEYFCAYFYASAFDLDEQSAIQVVKGAMAKPVVPHISAIDYVARGGIDGILTTEEHTGYYDSNGNIVAQTQTNLEYYTDKIDITPLKSIRVSLEYESVKSMWLVYVSFDANGDFIARTTIVPSKNFDKYSTDIYFANTVKYVSFCYRSYGEGTLTITATPDPIASLNWDRDNKEILDGLVAETQSIESDLTATEGKTDTAFELGYNGTNLFRLNPCIDHLFVNDSSERTGIPHESVYHVRLSKALGYDVIEANIYPTSDGVYLVNHTVGGKFGRYLTHKDGITDVSDIEVSSVTWAWIVENLRYDSTIPKYRTRPCRLEEFLSECRQQNIIPFVGRFWNSDVKEICDKYMGKNNYIAYYGYRNMCPDAVIYHWVSKSTKAEILEYCESIGRPFIYGIANPTAFTDVQLKDIIDTLHASGYMIGVSYVDEDWYKYSYMGVDVNNSQTRINRIKHGNVADINSVFGFDGFTYTNATETDGVLTYSADGTLVPNVDTDTIDVGGIDLQIEFNGEIYIPSIGKSASKTYTSDGTIPVFISSVVIDKSPRLTMNVKSGTVVHDCFYKVSKI